MDYCNYCLSQVNLFKSGKSELSEVEHFGKMCEKCIEILMSLHIIFKDNESNDYIEYIICKGISKDKLVAVAYTVGNSPLSFDLFKRNWLAVRNIKE